MSGDSLNNFISIINKNFNTQFKEQFTDEDFKYVNALIGENKNHFEINNIFDYAK